jgi:hypothetical protein
MTKTSSIKRKHPVLRLNQRFFRIHKDSEEISYEFGYDTPEREVTATLSWKVLTIRKKKHIVRKFECHTDSLRILAAIKDVIKAINEHDNMSTVMFEKILADTGFTKY